MKKNHSGQAPLKHIINAKLIAYVIGILTWVEGGLLLIPRHGIISSLYTSAYQKTAPGGKRNRARRLFPPSRKKTRREAAKRPVRV